jgi:hypothetical protein
MSNSNNLKVLCIPHRQGRTKFLSKKMKNVPINTEKNNNDVMAMFTVRITFVDSCHMKLGF